MSGIIGIAHSDGSPVNSSMIREMTDWLSFRGPDAQQSWTNGPIGLGCALLHTTIETERDRQPATLNKHTWIVADVRLDARSELVASLRSQGQAVFLTTPDSELLLHAYAAWGEECVHHLLGDFAFVIWDDHRRQLFCACDPFGVKALYYAIVGGRFVFSNTLNCIRLHPEVSDRLNDAAITDFLLFGLNHGPSTTSFADIQRLPRAHVLVWTSSHLRLKEYWHPPTNGCIRYSRREDYIEHFRELLIEAVEDRLQTDRAGSLLSGGLDSSSVAAIACKLQNQKYPALRLQAFTEIFEKATQDSDAIAARTVAAHLRIPINLWAVDRIKPFERFDDPGVQGPEPTDDPFVADVLDEFREISKKVRVVLSGEGCDNLMDFEIVPHFVDLWKQHSWDRFLFDLLEHIVQRFRAPDGLRGPLRRIGRMFSGLKNQVSFPTWINASITARLNLRARWEDPLPNRPSKVHPLHPRGYASLYFPQWTAMFEATSPGGTRQPIEVRYPFLDLRLVNFLLAIRALPWFFRKHLLREAMRGDLPESIRLRPKTPLPVGLLAAEFSKSDAWRKYPLRESVLLDRYVDTQALPLNLRSRCPEESDAALRAICLNFWLSSYRKNGYTIRSEEKYAQGAVSRS